MLQKSVRMETPPARHTDSQTGTGPAHRKTTDTHATTDHGRCPYLTDGWMDGSGEGGPRARGDQRH